MISRLPLPMLVYFMAVVCGVALFVFPVYAQEESKATFGKLPPVQVKPVEPAKDKAPQPQETTPKATTPQLKAPRPALKKPAPLKPVPGSPPPPQPGPLPADTKSLPGQLHSTQVPELQRHADLQITELTLTPTSPRLDAYFTIRATIKNMGLEALQKYAHFQMEITDDPYMEFYRNVIPAFEKAIRKLGPGEQQLVVKQIKILHRYKFNNKWVEPEPGNYKLTAVINTSNFNPGEENSANNQVTKTFVLRGIPPAANLVLDNVSLTADCRIRLRFHNNGAAIPGMDFNAAKVSVAINGPGRQLRPLSEVDPARTTKKSGTFWGGITKYVTYTWPATTTSAGPGQSLASGETANVTVMIDPFRAINDMNYANNSRTETLSCP